MDDLFETALDPFSVEFTPHEGKLDNQQITYEKQFPYVNQNFLRGIRMEAETF